MMRWLRRYEEGRKTNVGNACIIARHMGNVSIMRGFDSPWGSIIRGLRLWMRYKCAAGTVRGLGQSFNISEFPGYPGSKPGTR